MFENLSERLERSFKILKGEGKITEINVAETVKDIPVMINMIRDYITKEYTVVSPKVVASLVSAFLYLVSRKDLINDRIPVLGLLDDIAVIGLAVKFSEPELRAYSEWKSAKMSAEAVETEAEEA